MKINREQMYDLNKQVYEKLEQKKFIEYYITSVHEKLASSGVTRQALVAPRKYQ